jgi:RNA recognition motif-containing protein
MPSHLLFANVPYDCSDEELREWIESRGVETESIHIIRDLVSGVSPAFAYAGLKNETEIERAVLTLNGMTMRSQRIVVSRAVERRRVPRQLPCEPSSFAPSMSPSNFNPASENH